MGLDVYLEIMQPTTVFTKGITHNLTAMASEAGIYKCLWRPEELGIERAGDLIEPLQAGLNILLETPDRFRVFNPENGWGSYEYLVEFLKEYLHALQSNPDAKVSVSR